MDMTSRQRHELDNYIMGDPDSMLMPEKCESCIHCDDQIKCYNCEEYSCFEEAT